MSYVMAVPELMKAAATGIATIGDTINAAHMAAAAPTGAVLPAAADEVSASIARLFSGYGQEYQKLAGEAAAFQEQFVQRLTRSADSYASAEAANVALLQPATASSVVSAVEPFLQHLWISGSNLLQQLFRDPTLGPLLYNAINISFFILLLPFLPLLIPVGIFFFLYLNALLGGF
jgi:hypothetical protein